MLPQSSRRRTTHWRSGCSLVRMLDRGGAIQAIDIRGFGKWAHANDSLIVLLHPILGDFVSAGAALMEVYGARSGARCGGLAARDDRRRRRTDDRAGPRLRRADHGRRVIRARALARRERPDDRSASVLDHLEDLLRLVGQTGIFDRGAPLERMRSGVGHSGEEVGRLPDAERHRDPRVWRHIDPGRATAPAMCSRVLAESVLPSAAMLCSPSHATDDATAAKAERSTSISLACPTDKVIGGPLARPSWR